MENHIPILHNDFLVSRRYKIKKRAFFNHHFEIYELESGSLLCLFKYHSFDTLKRIGFINLSNLHVGTKNYIYYIDDTTTLKGLTKHAKSLLNPKGFNAVAGMNQVKEELKLGVIDVLKSPEKYEMFDLQIPNGILLFGPPGCGKTFIIRRLAEELSYNFIEVKHSDLSSTYIHGTVEKIGKIFDSARESAPSIIFFDEIEGLVPKRDSVGSSPHKQEEVNEFLIQLNNLGEENVLVVCATNKPKLIDDALIRPGRIDKIIYIPPPDFQARKELFHLNLLKRPLNDIDFDLLAEDTINYSAADINYICDESARIAVKTNAKNITMETILHVINKTGRSISDDDLKEYNSFKDIERK